MKTEEIKLSVLTRKYAPQDTLSEKQVATEGRFEVE